MTIDEAFATIRGGIRADVKDGALDRESAAITLAMADVFEELMSKLERIAIASETIANTTATDGYGYPYIRTMTST